MFPFALISGYITEDFGQRLEVRILELEEDRAVFRTADRIGTVSRLEVYFYDDRAGQTAGDGGLSALLQRLCVFLSRSSAYGRKIQLAVFV